MVQREQLMATPIELDDAVVERIESHLEEGETIEEFIEELLTVYETEGVFIREGYSE